MEVHKELGWDFWRRFTKRRLRESFSARASFLNLNRLLKFHKKAKSSIKHINRISFALVKL
jgi:hypothetical protein